MFAKEAEMTDPVARWMRSGGMDVKSEFLTPWGACDLVGMRFDPEKVAHRLRLRQMRSISSITRAFLLLQIPETEDGKLVTIKKLVRESAPSIPENVVRGEMARLIEDGFAVTTSRGRLLKVNSLIPMHDRLVSVELKLSRIEEALNQALNNLGFADESYVAFPAQIAERVSTSPSRWRAFLDAGVGVLAVERHDCAILRPARKAAGWLDAAVQLYCVEKFWRTRAKDN
jgi:hypothetical protein